MSAFGEKWIRTHLCGETKWLTKNKFAHTFEKKNWKSETKLEVENKIGNCQQNWKMSTKLENVNKMEIANRIGI